MEGTVWKLWRIRGLAKQLSHQAPQLQKLAAPNGGLPTEVRILSCLPGYQKKMSLDHLGPSWSHLGTILVPSWAHRWASWGQKRGRSGLGQ